MQTTTLVITESVARIAGLKSRLPPDCPTYMKLDLLQTLQEGAPTIAEACRRIDLDASLGYRWCQAYREGGLQRLLTYNTSMLQQGKRGRPPALPIHVTAGLHGVLKSRPFRSYGAVQDWLWDTHRRELSLSAVRALVHRMECQGQIQSLQRKSAHGH